MGRWEVGGGRAGVREMRQGDDGRAHHPYI